MVSCCRLIDWSSRVESLAEQKEQREVAPDVPLCRDVAVWPPCKRQINLRQKDWSPPQHDTSLKRLGVVRTEQRNQVAAWDFGGTAIRLAGKMAK